MIGTCLALGATLIVAVTQTPSFATETKSSTTASTAEPVELTNLTTPTQQVFRNPDGTMTANLTTEPVRVKRGRAWVPVDTTLQYGPDGSISPVATVSPLKISRGGSEPLVLLGSPGRAYSMSWPNALPAPSLDGDIATYGNVYPDVDLVVRALTTGFEESLVVKTAAAAALPQVRSIRLNTRVDGLKARARAGGGFDVVDGLGAVAFTSAAAAMWDSPDVAATASAPSRVTVSGIDDLAADNPEDPPIGGPADGSAVLPVGESVGAASITLTPSLAALNDEDTTYPVVIDPTVTAPQYRRAMVNKTYHTTAYYNWTGTSSDNYSEGVGYNDTAGVNVKRLYFEFNQSVAANSTIVSAKFTPFERFAYSCTASQVNVYNTGGVSSATTWDNQPDLRALQDTATVAYGRSGCSPAGKGVDFNVKQGVSAVEAAGGTMVAFMVKSPNETTDAGWKRFSSGHEANTGPVLSIQYDHPPVTTNPRMSNQGVNLGCTKGAGRPTLNIGATSTLIAHGTDADGGNLTGTFGFHTYTDGINNGTALYTLTTAAHAQGSDFSVQLGHSLTNGQIYAWRMYVTETSSPNANSTSTSWCEFKQDSSAPPSTVVSSATYPSDSDGSGTWSQTSQPPPAGDFTFTTSDATDTAKYAWSWNGAGFPTTLTTANSHVADGSGGAAGSLRITAGGSPTITPPSSGRQVLTVWAVDAAGNHQIAGTDYPMLVKPSNTAARWLMNDTPGSLAAADGSGTNACVDGGGVAISCPLTLTGDAVLTAGVGAQTIGAGASDGGLVLNADVNAPAAGEATSAEGLINTGQSLTVEAWVQMPVGADQSINQTAVSIDGANGSGLTLGWDALLGRFAFSMAQSDPTTGAPVLDQAVDGLAADPLPGVWVFLAGVYDASANQISLWEGSAAPTFALTAPAVYTAHTSTWATSGAIHVGDGEAGGGRVDPWVGFVDGVRIVPGTRDFTHLNTDLQQAS